MQLAISGSAGTGKTTLVTALASKLDCAAVAECYDDFFDDDFDFIKPASRLQRQIAETLELKHNHEEELGEFVADRCPADLFNLWLSQGFGENQKKTVDLYNRCRTYIRKYDRIVVLPWSALPLVQVERHIGRRRRAMNAWTQLHNHSTVIGLLHQWVSPSRLLPVPFDSVYVNSRVEFIVTSLKTNW